MNKSPEQIDREVRALAGSMLASKRPTERLSELDAQIDRALSGIEDTIGIKRRGRRRTKSEIAKARADAAKIRKEAADQKKRAAEIKKKAREDAARAKKIAAEEKKRAAKIKKQAAAEKKKATAAKRERKTAVRDAAAIRKRARVSAAKTTLAAKTAAPASRASDADQRAAVVRSAISKVGSAGRFGDKVFVHPIWKIAGDKLGMTLAEFKLLLLALNRAGKITLARLDLIGAIKDQDMVRLSEIEDRGATFHTVMA
jgi:chromosome segregation ATPase